MDNDTLCGNTYIPQYGTEEPCEQTLTDCIVFEGAIPQLSLNDNPNLTAIIQNLLAAIQVLQQQTIITSETGNTKHRIIVDDAGNLSTVEV